MTAHEITTITEALRHAKLADLREPLAKLNANEVLRNLRAHRESFEDLMEGCRLQDSRMSDEWRDLFAALVYQAIMERLEEHTGTLDEKLRRYAKSLERKMR